MNYPSDMPAWMAPQTPWEAEREAMDYELMAEYDRYDGLREEMRDWCGEQADQCEGPVSEASSQLLAELEEVSNREAADNWDDIPF